MRGRATTRAALALVWTASVVSALASCNFIVGVGDYSVGDADTDGTAAEGMDGAGPQPDAGLFDVGAAQPDADGSGPDVAQADVVGDGNEASRGVSDGPIDSATDVRSDAAGGHEAGGGGPTDASDAATRFPDASDGGNAVADANDGAPEAEAAAPLRCGQGLPTGQSDFQKLVSTCLLAVSCDPYFFNVNLSQCITGDYLESTGSIACLSTIQDCDGFYSCEGRRYATTTECPVGSTSVTCDPVNNLAIDCGAGIVNNCSKYGGTCGTYLDDTGTLAVGCEVAPSCTPGDGGDQCLGNKLYSCAPSGVAYGRDCTTIGATCLSNPVDGTSCYYDAPACGDGGANACNGGTLSACTLEGRALNFNCTRAAGSCAIDNTGTGYCLAPGCSIASTCSESCGPDGHTMTVCVGNAPYKIDCAQYASFKSCDQVLDTSGNPFAYCY